MPYVEEDKSILKIKKKKNIRLSRDREIDGEQYEQILGGGDLR